MLGINKVSLSIPPGITSLVGPNGSGKTTLMNLMTGLIRPSQGEIRVLGISPDDPEKLCRAGRLLRAVRRLPEGHDGLPVHLLVPAHVRLHQSGMREAHHDRRCNWSALTDATNRPVAAYSKGMRQRVKLAQAIAHDPKVVVLDEPLNGLDPLARAEAIALFRAMGQRRAARASCRATSCTRSIASPTR